MKSVALRALMALTVILAVLAAVSYVRGLRADLAAAQQAEQLARQGNADRDDIIKGLREDAKAKEQARARLEADRNEISSNLATRELMIRDLENENKELRDWSAVRLPGVIIGLRDHPAITGAADYRQRMRTSDALQSSSNIGQD